LLLGSHCHSESIIIVVIFSIVIGVRLGDTADQRRRQQRRDNESEEARK
jgi:L-cystine uptake protein TcyP (sodium:dicarboxylate symporter family)